jgi:hypothetical protein
MDLEVDKGKDEYYITYSDVNIVLNPATGPPNPLTQQDPQTAAVPDFKSRAAGKVKC